MLVYLKAENWFITALGIDCSNFMKTCYMTIKNLLKLTCIFRGPLLFSWYIFTFKDNFGILHLKPCFKIVSDEIVWLRLKFGHMLLS